MVLYYDVSLNATSHFHTIDSISHINKELALNATHNLLHKSYLGKLSLLFGTPRSFNRLLKPFMIRMPLIEVRRRDKILIISGP